MLFINIIFHAGGDGGRWCSSCLAGNKTRLLFFLFLFLDLDLGSVKVAVVGTEPKETQLCMSPSKWRIWRECKKKNFLQVGDCARQGAFFTFSRSPIFLLVFFVLSPVWQSVTPHQITRTLGLSPLSAADPPVPHHTTTVALNTT